MSQFGKISEKTDFIWVSSPSAPSIIPVNGLLSIVERSYGLDAIFFEASSHSICRKRIRKCCNLNRKFPNQELEPQQPKPRPVQVTVQVERWLEIPSGKLQSALDKLLVLEKQTRNAAIVEFVMGWLEDVKKTAGVERWLELIQTLRTVTEGKIFLETPRAHVTLLLAHYHESLATASGPSTYKEPMQMACDLLSDLQTEFILEKMRLLIVVARLQDAELDKNGKEVPGGGETEWVKNVRVVTQYYTRITLPRLTSLLDQARCRQRRQSPVVWARINHPAGETITKGFLDELFILVSHLSLLLPFLKILVVPTNEAITRESSGVERVELCRRG
ncbi:hypothetical protein B0H11DRAFT_1920947 [Mycena galericulata]|nr:hypothetical protein B0H11DRAFT_1920947 [Mycena galericulata]